MKVTKISVTKGRTINLGNYNSMRIEYSAEAEIGEKESFQKIRLNLNNLVEEWLEEEHGAILEEAKGK